MIRVPFIPLNREREKNLSGLVKISLKGKKRRKIDNTDRSMAVYLRNTIKVDRLDSFERFKLVPE